MKFNTITLDANLPTTQQVNVPTNTDYKVGMKVKRNGEVQSIKPSEFTIYTGETEKVKEYEKIPSTPLEYQDIQSKYVEGDAVVLIPMSTVAESGMSGLVGKRLYAENISLEATYTFNGTTKTIDESKLYFMFDKVKNPAGETVYVEIDAE